MGVREGYILDKLILRGQGYQEKTGEPFADKPMPKSLLSSTVNLSDPYPPIVRKDY